MSYSAALERDYSEYFRVAKQFHFCDIGHSMGIEILEMTTLIITRIECKHSTKFVREVVCDYEELSSADRIKEVRQ